MVAIALVSTAVLLGAVIAVVYISSQPQVPYPPSIPSQDLEATTQNVSISINGLTCQMPTPEPQILYSLVPQVVQDPRFLNLTKGEVFVFGNGEKISISERRGNVTSPTTEMMEMVFYQYNSTTYCGGPTALLIENNTMFAHVPYENGSFNMADATFGRRFP